MGRYLVRPVNPSTGFNADVEFFCLVSGYSTPFVLTLKSIEIKGAGASGDPHFSQFVYDKKSKSRKMICYDVVGKANQLINILSFEKEKIKISGKLQDDYYMHLIKVNVFNKTVKVTVDGIYLNNNLIGFWNKTLGDKIVFGNFELSMHEKSIHLRKLIGKVLSIVITRSSNMLDRNHLNVFFKYSNYQYRELGGMIGDIGKQSFEILQNIQENNSVFVILNGKLVQGKTVVRENEECILLDTKSLLEFNSDNQYIHF